MGRTRVHFVRCLITANKLVRAKISTLRRDIVLLTGIARTLFGLNRTVAHRYHLITTPVNSCPVYAGQLLRQTFPRLSASFIPYLFCGDHGIKASFSSSHD